MHSHNVSRLFLNLVDVDSRGSWGRKQGLIQLLSILISMALFCSVVLGQDKSLSFTVVDLQGKPIEFVELAVSGISSPAVTDKQGKARIRLSSEIRPNTEVEVRLARSPRNMVFISPWDGRITIPGFREVADDDSKIVLAERGSRFLLEDVRALKALVSNILLHEAPQTSLEEALERRRETAMAEIFRLFGLKQDEAIRALRLWREKAKDPFEKAQADFLARNFSKASAGFAEAFTFYKSGQGKFNVSEFEMRFSLGRSRYEEGKFEESVAAYNDALNLREDDLVTLRSLTLILSRLTKYAEAELLYRRILAIKEKTFGADSLEVAITLNDLAGGCQEQAKYADAESFYGRSLAIREKAQGSDHLDVALTLSGLAELYRLQGRHAEAEPVFKRCLAIMEKVHGPIHYSLVATLSHLALLYGDQGKFEDAEPLLLRSLAIAEKTIGPDQVATATVLNNIANLYQIQGKLDEAEPFYKRDLAISERALGSDHPSVAVTLNNLAGIYKKQGKYDEAEVFYKRALSNSEKAMGTEHPNVAIALNNLAELYRMQDRFAEAEPLFLRSIAIKEAKIGLEHPSLAAPLSNLSGVYFGQGKYEEAESLIKRALAIIEKSYGSDHPSLVRMLRNYAFLLRELKRTEEATKIEERAASIRSKQTKQVP